MDTGSAQSARCVAHRKRRVRVITHSLWIFCLPIFASIGFVGRELLVSQGVAVLAISEAKRLFIPYMLFHELAAFICSFCIRSACFKAFDGEDTRFSAYILRVIDPNIDAALGKDFPRLEYSIVGACTFVAFLISGSLLGGALATGPGGFAEVVIMEIAMFPLTLGYLLVLSLLAAAIGGLIGSSVYTAKSHMKQ